MQFGMPTLIELRSLEETAALCHELGLGFVELNMDLPQYQADKLDVSELRQIADKYGIYYTIHLEDTAYPWNFNKRISEAYTQTVLRTIETAKALGTPILNMHFHQGEYFTLPDRKSYLLKEYPDDFRQKLMAFREACAKAVGSADIKICIKNTNAFQLDFVADAIALLLESPVFGLTFDIGHNAVNNFHQQQVIERNINRLHHIHLHDAVPKEKRDHLVFGEGELDLRKYLGMAKEYNCRAVIEVKTAAGLRSSVEWLNVMGLA